MAEADEDLGAPATGSRTRDHLANERTYLAWVRTGANVMVLGLAVAKLVAHQSDYSLAAGALLVVTGVIGIGIGTRRFRRVSLGIEHGRFDSGAGERTATISSVVFIVVFLATLILLALGP